MTKEDLQAKYELRTKKIIVKAWGDEEVTIREMSVGAKGASEAVLFSDTDVENVKDGQIKIDIGNAQESTLIAVSAALVEPRMKVAELKDLPAGAMDGITEIKAALDAWDKPVKGKPKVKASSTD